jgi:hypothetical protein
LAQCVVDAACQRLNSSHAGLRHTTRALEINAQTFCARLVPWSVSCFDDALFIQSPWRNRSTLQHQRAATAKQKNLCTLKTARARWIYCLRGNPRARQ